MNRPLTNSADRDGVARQESLDRSLRPGWLTNPDDRDHEADAAEAGDTAAGRDSTAARRDQDAAAREREVAGCLATAHQRLDEADMYDARLWAVGLADVEAARAEHAAKGTEASRIALTEAEVACEAQTVLLIRCSLERQAIREDLDRIAQHLAAARLLAAGQGHIPAS